jgi:Sulfatase
MARNPSVAPGLFYLLLVSVLVGALVPWSWFLRSPRQELTSGLGFSEADRIFWLPQVHDEPANLHESSARRDQSNEPLAPADELLTEEPTEGTKGPLNIVLLYADDWTMKTLGVLNKVVRTPNLDALAESGMLFTNNCVTTSICWISRATLVTGQYAAVHNQLKISDGSMFEAGKWNNTLFYQLKQTGKFHTGIVGKWHAPSPPKPMAEAFDFSRLYYGSHWVRRNGALRHVTDLNTEDALDFLKARPKDRNFALMVSFFAIHAQDGVPFPRDWEPTNQSARWYPESETIPAAYTNTQQHWDDLPWFFDHRNEGRIRWKTDLMCPKGIRSPCEICIEW